MATTACKCLTVPALYSPLNVSEVHYVTAEDMYIKSSPLAIKFQHKIASTNEEFFAPFHDLLHCRCRLISSDQSSVLLHLSLQPVKLEPRPCDMNGGNVVSIGSHYPFNKHQVPHFFPLLTHLKRFTTTFTAKLFQFTIYPNFCSFCFGQLYWPQFCFFILPVTCSTLVMGLSLRGNDFSTQLPLKIGSLAKTFLLAPSFR